MRFTSLIVFSSISAALHAWANPVVQLEGMLSARDQQPICKNGKKAGCDGGLYSSAQECEERCYGVCA